MNKKIILSGKHNIELIERKKDCKRINNILPTIDKKYLGKEIYIAFIEDDIIKVYYHDEVVNSLAGSILETESWNINGNYSWPKTPNLYKDLITKLND